MMRPIRMAILCTSVLLGGVLLTAVARGGFTLKRPTLTSCQKMREDYCAEQVALLREMTGLVQDAAVVQDALIGDVQSFLEGGSAPCSAASKEQLAEATDKTRKMAGQIGQMRQKMRDYTKRVRLFLPDDEQMVVTRTKVP